MPLHSKDYLEFTKLLRQARSEVGLSQTELADLLGADQTYVSKCETGGRRMDIIELRAWVRALGVPLASFIEDFDAKLEALAVSRSAAHNRARRGPDAK